MRYVQCDGCVEYTNAQYNAVNGVREVQHYLGCTGLVSPMMHEVQGGGEVGRWGCMEHMMPMKFNSALVHALACEYVYGGRIPRPPPLPPPLMYLGASEIA